VTGEELAKLRQQAAPFAAGADMPRSLMRFISSKAETLVNPAAPPAAK
jgi:hypothetical protein